MPPHSSVNAPSAWKFILITFSNNGNFACFARVDVLVGMMHVAIQFTSSQVRLSGQFTRAIIIPYTKRTSLEMANFSREFNKPKFLYTTLYTKRTRLEMANGISRVSLTNQSFFIQYYIKSALVWKCK